MLVKDWMSKSVITIGTDESVNDASRIFQTRVISMLPVIDNGKLVGVLTDGDLKKALPSDATTLDRYEIASLLDSLKIETIMSAPAVFTQSDHTVDEVAGTMLGKGISGMPVLGRGGRLEGVITKSDIFRCFVSFTGVANNGQIFAFKLMDKPGLIKTITDTIRESNGRLCSILTSYDDIEDGFRKVFFHTFDIESESFINLVERFQGSGKLLYAADLSRGFRRLF